VVLVGASIGAMSSIEAATHDDIEIAALVEVGGINNASGYSFSRSDLAEIEGVKTFASRRGDIYTSTVAPMPRVNGTGGPHRRSGWTFSRVPSTGPTSCARSATVRNVSRSPFSTPCGSPPDKRVVRSLRIMRSLVEVADVDAMENPPVPSPRAGCYRGGGAR